MVVEGSRASDFSFEHDGTAAFPLHHRPSGRRSPSPSLRDREDEDALILDLPALFEQPIAQPEQQQVDHQQQQGAE